jgi:hypothetical protein
MSDDDYDERRGGGRDKFRTERSGDDRRGDRRGDRYDDDGGNNFKGDRGRSRYDQDRQSRRDYSGRDHYGRDDREKRRRSPQDEGRYHREPKRYRPDNDDDMGGGGGGGYRGGRGGHSGAWHGNRNHHHHHHHHDNGFNNHQQQQQQNDDDILLTFKAWVIKQDDNINEDDACKNFKLYKAEFKKKQLQEFFVTHKDEEWFRDKYHPDASDERSTQFKDAVKHRFEAWKKLAEIENVFDETILDDTKEEKTIKLLETAVMLMEGASEEDVQLINSVIPKKNTDGAKSEADTNEEKSTNEDDEDKKRDKFSRINEDAQSDDEKSEKNENKEENIKEENNDDEEDGEVNDPSDLLEKKRNEALKRIQTTYSSIFMRSLPPTISRQDISNMCTKFEGYIRVAFSHPQGIHN